MIQEQNVSSTSNIKTVALRFYEPLRDGDTSRTKEFLSPTWQDVPLNDGQSSGPDGYAEMVKKLRSFLPKLEWQIDDVIVGDDRVVVRSTVRGTPEGHAAGIHFTGHLVHFTAIDIHQITGGFIATTWHVEDKMSILRQFGIPHLSFR